VSHSDNQLPIPPDAMTDPKSIEMVRAWIVDGGLQASLQMGIWEDVRAWGILLADIVKYVADAKEKGGGMDRSQTIRQIRKSFIAELDASTCESEGDFVH
jgi:hypothetical protein